MKTPAPGIIQCSTDAMHRVSTALRLLILFLLLTQTSLAATLTVKQDSAGDYLHIQDAINASTDGDTVLVWPGTYFENLDMNLHNITLASLDLTTGEPQYKYNTIIDGSNNDEACLWTLTLDTEFTIRGFTLQNGSGHEGLSGTAGGGLHIVRADVSVINCVIKNNFASYFGGGIYSVMTNLYLSGTTIKNNHAGTEGGGGLYFQRGPWWLEELEFDSINLCSIFNNHAYYGADFVTGKYTEAFAIPLDTFSVSQPGRQHIYATADNFFPDDRITVEMNHFMRESVNTDLFVSPEGDDANSGLSAGEPLKSLTKAVQIIVSDSVQKNTIHLANGTYSPSTTGEFFPVGLYKNISIIGQGRDSTILDAEHFTQHIKSPRLEHSTNLKRLSLINGMADYISYNERGSFFFVFCDSITVEDVRFSGNTGYHSSTGGTNSCSNLKLRNVIFENNIGGKTLRIGSGYHAPEYPRLTDSVFLENCIFRNNLPNPDSAIGYGGALSTQSIGNTDADSLVVIVTNCLFENNVADNGIYASDIFSGAHNSKTIFTNCTFADNTALGSEYSRVFGLNGYWPKAQVYNSIFYGGYPREMYIALYEDDYPARLWIYNSLLAGGYEGIGGDVDVSDVIYDPTNIDTDPIFLGKWEHPYQIADGSPCIDAGTLANLPDFIELPEFDLAGNPRVVGDSIDMGAYEWNPTVGVDEYLPVFKKEKPKLLRAAPNPFTHQTTLSAKWEFTGHVQIEIYNNAGLRVKVLKSGASGPGSIQTVWDATSLPAGIYHVVMFWDGKEVEGLKVVKR